MDERIMSLYKFINKIIPSSLIYLVHYLSVYSR